MKFPPAGNHRRAASTAGRKPLPSWMLLPIWKPRAMLPVPRVELRLIVPVAPEKFTGWTDEVRAVENGVVEIHMHGELGLCRIDGKG
jgi:hypothetical protein